MTLPEITIQIVGYNRPAELRKTIDSLQTNLVYPADRLRWMMVDDCSPSDDVRKVCEAAGITYYSSDENAGWGANLNHALSRLETDYVFFNPDHVYLLKRLDLRLGISILEQDYSIGMLRYTGTFDTFHASLKSVDAREYAPEYGAHIHQPGRVYYWNIHTPAFYIYSDWPHLKHRRFHDRHGTFDNSSIHDVEFGFSQRVNSNLEADGTQGRVAVMAEWVDWHWQHEQAFSFQRKGG